MPITNIALLQKELGILAQAKDSERGLVIRTKSVRDAWNLRFRCYRARAIVRDKSRDVYTPGDPGYNTSPFDQLRMYVEEAPDPRLVIRKEDLPGVLSIEEVEEL